MPSIRTVFLVPVLVAALALLIFGVARELSIFPDSAGEPAVGSAVPSGRFGDPELGDVIPRALPESERVTGPNLITNPSLETGSGDTPSGWTKDSWGVLSAFFSYPVPGHSDDRAARVSVTSYSGGDAKWYFGDVPVKAGAEYFFSDRYRASVLTEVTARYTMSDGSYRYVWIGSARPSDSWARYSASLTAPAGAVSVTVFHLIAAKGTLTVDDYSLVRNASSFAEGMVSFVFDDGFLSAYEALPILEEAGIRSTQAIITGRLGRGKYVSADQVRDMAAHGHEIASHTRTHADLTDVSAPRLVSELAGSREDLAALGITADTFVYPYGSYDPEVVDAVISAGYSAARSVDEGHNTSVSDPYLLRDRHVTSVTTFKEVRGWIDGAIAKRQWLVLEFHEQDADAGEYGNDPELLREIAAYVRSAGVRTVTLGEGASMLER